MKNLRGFKAETKQATDTAPEKIKLTDLRFNKTITISYGATTASGQKDRIIEYLKELGIEITAQTWAENTRGQHLYSIYLTDNFNIQIK